MSNPITGKPFSPNVSASGSPTYPSPQIPTTACRASILSSSVGSLTCSIATNPLMCPFRAGHWTERAPGPSGCGQARHSLARKHEDTGPDPGGDFAGAAQRHDAGRSALRVSGGDVSFVHGEFEAQRGGEGEQGKWFPTDPHLDAALALEAVRGEARRRCRLDPPHLVGRGGALGDL